MKRATKAEIAQARTRKELSTLAYRYGYSGRWVDLILTKRERKKREPHACSTHVKGGFRS